MNTETTPIEMPAGFGQNGRRQTGRCPRCSHYGSDCKCTIDDVRRHRLSRQRRLIEQAEELDRLLRLFRNNIRQGFDPSKKALNEADAVLAFIDGTAPPKPLPLTTTRAGGETRRARK